MSYTGPVWDNCCACSTGVPKSGSIRARKNWPGFFPLTMNPHAFGPPATKNNSDTMYLTGTFVIQGGQIYLSGALLGWDANVKATVVVVIDQYNGSPVSVTSTLNTAPNSGTFPSWDLIQWPDSPVLDGTQSDASFSSSWSYFGNPMSGSCTLSSTYTIAGMLTDTYTVVTSSGTFIDYQVEIRAWNEENFVGDMPAWAQTYTSGGAWTYQSWAAEPSAAPGPGHLSPMVEVIGYDFSGPPDPPCEGGLYPAYVTWDANASSEGGVPGQVIMQRTSCVGLPALDCVETFYSNSSGGSSRSCANVTPTAGAYLIDVPSLTPDGTQLTETLISYLKDGTQAQGGGCPCCPAYTLATNPSPVPNGTHGTAYGPSGNGCQVWGNPPSSGSITPTVTSGSLPPGLSLVLDGISGLWTIEGTPTTAGSYSFTISAADACSCNATPLSHTIVIS